MANGEMARQGARTRFYARSALVMLAIVLVSFPATYFGPVLKGTGRFAPIYHLHGAAFFAWIGLYAWQTHLVAAGRTARHREFGLFGLALAGMMVPLGFALAIAAIERRLANGAAYPYDYALYNLSDMLSFSVLMALSIGSITRHIEWHRRFTLAASVALTGPAISRLFPAWPSAHPGDAAPNLAASLFLVALAVHDWRRLGRVHPATLGCLAVMVPLSLATPFIAASPWWRATAPALLQITRITAGMDG